MSRQTFTIEIDDSILRAALTRAQQEGKSTEQVLVDLITQYAQGGEANSAPPAPLEPEPQVVPESPLVPPETPPSSSQTPASQPIEGASYSTIPIEGAITDRPAHLHADLNLALRGYVPTAAESNLVDVGGPTDSRAPQLAGLFAEARQPQFGGTYQVHAWQWGPPPDTPGTPDNPISDPPVTLLGLVVSIGETIHVPSAGYEIYGGGFQVMLLYATSERLTLTYTRQDNIIHGYALHLEGVHPEPTLLTLYERMNGEGRSHLPALPAGYPLGRAIGSEIKVAIRDTGRFMDPRVRKDWWR